MAQDPHTTANPGLGFTVDTHLLRELGSLLVGRDSTALIELIKNAYDADAKVVVIHGENLASRGYISVTDDGHGMTYEDFVGKFLRIAGRSKEGGDRKSPKYERKYTGAKGIGRLSSHKLGGKLSLESTPRGLGEEGFSATIDWDAIENSDETLERASGVEVTRRLSSSSEPGTLLTIGRLHSEWGTRQLNRFLSEVRSTRPDEIFFKPLDRDVVLGELLVPEISVADSKKSDPGFRLVLSGEFSGTEPQWPTLLANVNWVLEVDARNATEVFYRLTPTVATRKVHSGVKQHDFRWHRATPGPRFVARILIRGGAGRGGSSGPLPDILEKFSKDAAGIRLFFEGFRVLPYGAPRNDWLNIDQSYVKRDALQFLDDFSEDLPKSENDERTYQAPNANHFGAVFLMDKDSDGMQMVVNREGFLPGDSFDHLTETVMRGISLGVRLRARYGAAAAAKSKEVQSARHEEMIRDLSAPRPDGVVPQRDREKSVTAKMNEVLIAGKEAARSLRTDVGAQGTQKDLQIVRAVLDHATSSIQRLQDEQSQLRVLASLGTQVGAFVHEVNGLLGQARLVRDLIDSLIDEGAVAPGKKSRWREVSRAQNELVSGLERQAVYLSDSIGAEARRRRVRVKVIDGWTTAKRLLGDAAHRREVEIDDDLHGDEKFPPMFPAEVNVILTNVLSNAIKAASVPTSSGPRSVTLRSRVERREILVTLENTGESVDVPSSERWFEPFESTTGSIDAALGQGLGLGLPLTRRIVEEYGGRINFIPPSYGMATAIQISLPQR